MSLTEIPLEISFRRCNGVRLETAACGPADGPLVILLHGFPDCWQGWRVQIPALNHAGFRVLAPNLRGYGQSDKPPGVAAYDLDLLADDVLALADTEHAGPFNLVGHDWGGLVAWWTAARFTNRVTRLAVINAPHPGAFQPYVWRHPGQLLRSWYIGLFQIPRLPEAWLGARHGARLFRAMQATAPPGLFTAADHAELARGWSRPGALTAMVNYYRALVRRPQNQRLLRVCCPTLILFGKLDPTEQPGLHVESRQFADRAELVSFDDCWHWPHREAPDRVNPLLCDFLGRLLPLNNDVP